VVVNMRLGIAVLQNARLKGVTALTIHLVSVTENAQLA